jgi:hypothetical protein
MNKKEITLKEAYSILENAAGVIVDDNVLIYPSINELANEPDNEFLYLSWNEDGEDFEVNFLEKDNEKVVVSGCSIFLVDSDGEENQITILAPLQLA